MLNGVTNIGYGGGNISSALPSVLAELQGLSFNLIAGAAPATLMPLPGIEAEDTIAKVINMTDLTEVVTTHVTISDRRPTGTITLLTTLANGDTVTVNSRIYTFTDMILNFATNLRQGIVPITVTPSGIDPVAVAALLAKTIMSSDSTLTCVAVGAVVTIFDRTAGTAGNTKTLATSSAHATVSGATLAGGSIPGVANGILCSDSLTAKKVLVIWYDKNAPGSLT